MDGDRASIMTYQPHYIANYEENGGLDKYFEPFLIPEKAFQEMEDVYAWRGRVKKKDGIKHLGRLRRVLTTAAMGNISAAGAGTFTFNLITAMGLSTTQPNAEIEPGNLTNITIAIGAPISQSLIDTLGTGVMTVVGAGPITSARLNYSTGVLSITFSGAAGSSAATFTGAYYPSLPCMGLPRQETDIINQEDFIAFDTRYAYKIVGTQFRQLGTATWNGANDEFFWCKNYFQNTNGKLLWVSNFHRGAVNDPIRYWDGVSWTNFSPILRANDATNPYRLLQALCFVPYKGRFVMFNTFEGNNATSVDNYPQRMRWCQNGTPLTIGTLNAGPPVSWNQVGAWADDRVGYGGYVDAPTSEHIVSVEFIKDTLLVKFERSSWKVVYTGNESLPFIFEKINTELGAESTFSLVPFDRGVFAFGNYGITTDDSVNVSRIDQRVPYIAFNANNDNSGVKRIHGIRDFARELVYWTFPSFENDPTFPNKVLVYNYINQTFSFFNDSFTCFGFYQEPVDYTWATLPYKTWAEWDDPWNSGSQQSQYPDIVAGNQQGFISILETDKSGNDFSLSLKDINAAVSPTQFTVINHNLLDGQFVRLTDIRSLDAEYLALNDSNFKIEVFDANTLLLRDENGDYVDLTNAGAYLGGGLIEVISNFSLKTKTFSPFYEQGAQARLGYIDFLLNTTVTGEVRADIYIDENDTVSINDPTITSGGNGLLGSNVLLTRPENLTILPSQANQDKIWHRMYFQMSCQNFFIWFDMSDAQMFDEDTNSCDFTLHAMTIYLSKNARMIQ